ncbi:MAG: hypothetical protein HFI09_02235 [Bacilli bacterium]|nr:hypothetical protein [Bacilli bacterium]
MKEEIKKVLGKLEKNGFESYIVGGFVRDYLLCRESTDVDIVTNALPKDIVQIFGSSKVLGAYGTFNIKTNHYNYDITTYRTESKYQNRHPKEITYTSNLFEDLKRRDFTINAICMTMNSQIIDVYNGVTDLENKVIRMIGDPLIRLKEDPLRILRAIRFACTLDFHLEDALKKAIKENKEKVISLSDYRLKNELNKILLSPNYQKGLDLLTSFGLLELLEIKPSKICYVDDTNGMWAQLKTTRDFGFTKTEKKQIEAIRVVLKEEKITPLTIYQYGLYPVMVASKIKQIPTEQILKIEQSMPLKSREDLALSFLELKKIRKTSNEETKKIQNQIIEEILMHQLPNQKEDIKKYLERE